MDGRLWHESLHECGRVFFLCYAWVQVHTLTYKHRKPPPLLFCLTNGESIGISLLITHGNSGSSHLEEDQQSQQPLGSLADSAR